MWLFMWICGHLCDLDLLAVAWNLHLYFLCSYEGEQVDDLYEGEGFICFESGDTYKVSVWIF